MLHYHDLGTVEKEMVDAEIRSNFSSSSKFKVEFNRVMANVHSGRYCCNCFRTEQNCCCDKIENCFDELDDTEDLLYK